MQYQLVSTAQQVARRLLILAAMSASGCIVPETLTPDSPPQHVTPVILSDTDPPFGLLPLGMTEGKAINVVASSSNIDDHLYARLFGQTNGDPKNPLFLVYDTIPLATDPSDPQHFRRKGPFDPRVYCSLVGRSNFLWLVVANQTFPDTSDVPLGGCCADAKEWLLSGCL